MSAALSGWQSRILWGFETSPGTAVAGTILWASQEKDSLAFGDKLVDMTKMFTGNRGIKSVQMRAGNYGPSGDLGMAPMYLDGSSMDALQLAYTHFQSYTKGTVVEGTVYSYTFTHSTAQLDLANMHTVSLYKDTGMGTGKCPFFAGCIFNAMEFSWDFGGAVMWKPSVMALSGTQDGSATATATPPASGFMQAPNINVTFNGNPIYPIGWTVKFDGGVSGVPAPNTDAYRTFSLGDLTGEVTLKTWRDSDFYGSFVAPYATETIGTLIITATVDTMYGTLDTGSSMKAIWTAYVRQDKRPDLPLTRGDMVDTITLQVVTDVAPSLVIHSKFSGSL